MQGDAGARIYPMDDNECLKGYLSTHREGNLLPGRSLLLKVNGLISTSDQRL